MRDAHNRIRAAPQHPSPMTAQDHADATRTLRGITFMAVTILIFSLMDAMAKYLSADYPTIFILWVRYVFQFLFMAALLIRARASGFMRTKRLGLQVGRAMLNVASTFAFIFGLAFLPLADAVALNMVGPLFLTALSVPLLGEKVGIRRWSACIVGFIGVLIMTRPGAGVWDMAALVPLLAAMFYALAMISIRKLTGTEQSGTIVFYFTLFATCAGLSTAPLGGVWPELAWVWPSDLKFWGIVVLIGLMGGCGQILITIAFRCAPVSVVAPFDYMALVYGFLLGFVFFHEVPDGYLIVGGLVVVASGIYIVHRETVVARQRRQAQPEPALPLPPEA